MNKITRRTDVKVVWIDIPLDNLIDEVQKGKTDAAISALNYGREHDKQVDFSNSCFYSEDAFLVANSFSIKVEKHIRQ